MFERSPPDLNPLFLELPNHMSQDQFIHIDNGNLYRLQLLPQEIVFLLELTSQLISVAVKELAEGRFLVLYVAELLLV